MIALEDIPDPKSDLLVPNVLNVQHRSVKRLRPTAYLDGLRGLAALVVYFAHNLLSANGLLEPLEVAWGYEGSNHFLVNFPFLRILFTGSHAAVPIFFIISGFVQSRKPLGLILEGDQSVYTVLASGIFRRGFRLQIPVLGTALCFMTLWHVLGIVPYFGQYESSFYADLKYFFHNAWYWTYIFKTNDIKIDESHTVNQWFAYNGHTWTVPIELQGSFHILVLLLVFSKAKPAIRKSILALTSIYFLLEGGVYWFCFPIGAVLCELDLSYGSKSAHRKVSDRKYRKHLCVTVLLLGIYLGGVPVRGFALMSIDLLSQQPGYYYISYLIPSIYFDVTHFLGTISAFCIVFATIGLTEIHQLFEMRFLQYLGRLSFSLYLCHGPILSTLGILMYRIVGKITEPPSRYDSLLPVPLVGPRGMDLPFFVANLVIFPVTLCASEVCFKLFDNTSIQLAQWAWQGVSSET